mmetsp:Transcript_24422/g.49567  ORF Transcript_24422/g.49567 Transcript_24422/m.49567 type:complete len:279 (+) Transcript_24422:232-1068(+)
MAPCSCCGLSSSIHLEAHGSGSHVDDDLTCSTAAERKLHGFGDFAEREDRVDDWLELAAGHVREQPLHVVPVGVQEHVRPLATARGGRLLCGAVPPQPEEEAQKGRGRPTHRGGDSLGGRRSGDCDHLLLGVRCEDGSALGRLVGGIEGKIIPAEHLLKFLRPVIDDDVGAERLHQVSLRPGRGGGRNRARPKNLGDLDAECADTARATRHEHLRARRHIPFAQGLECSLAGEADRGGVGEADTGGNLGEQRELHQAVLADAACEWGALLPSGHPVAH